MSTPKRLKRGDCRDLPDAEQYPSGDSETTLDSIPVTSRFFTNKTKSNIVTSSQTCPDYDSSNAIQPIEENSAVSEQFLKCVSELNINLSNLKFSKPVKFIYNPTIYATDTFQNYVKKYGNETKTVLFLGMNPGPWGMSQTGVPFGEIKAVRDWLKITGHILKPDNELPSRPVLGFECQRTEISGDRFWKLIQHLCDVPENFFRNSFVLNYCPLQLMTESGNNVTPDELKINDRQNLYELCDAALLQTLKIFNVEVVICIGKFAETRVNKALNKSDKPKVYSIPHPSPRAVGNQNWQEKAIKALETLDLLHLFNKS